MLDNSEISSKFDDEPLHDDEVGRSENIKVIVRVRPLLAFEEERGASASVVKLEPADGQSLTLAGGEARHQLRVKFDAVFGGQSRQEEVYAQVAECATAVAEGFNATVFAYGQTGTGKTHTMFGPPGHVQSLAAGSAKVSPQSGVIPRAIVDLLEHLRKLTVSNPTGSSPAGTGGGGGVGRSKKKSGREGDAAGSAAPVASSVTVFCSFVQIYNEQVFDMLRDPARSKPLEVHEDRLQGIYVQGLSEYQVRTFADCLELLRLGEENRATRETHMNMASSRSHSIFTLLVEQTRPSLNPGGEPRELRSKFNLVDLAGSEKWDLNVDMGADRVSEMTNINLSLYTLGRCIAALSAAGKKAASGAAAAGGMAMAGGGAAAADAHVPYRESKLTRLLQDSLGGNAKTRVVAALSPASDCIDESVSTLRFADRAKQVMVFLRQNEAQAIDPKLVEKLQREVAHLRLVVKQMTEHRSLNDKSSNGSGGVGAGGASTRGLSVSPVASPSKTARARGGNNSSSNPLLGGGSGGGLAADQSAQLEGALEEERTRSEALAQENAQLRAALEAAAKATQSLNLTQKNNNSSPIPTQGGARTPRGGDNSGGLSKSPVSSHGSSGNPHQGYDASPSSSSPQVEQAVRAAVARAEAKTAALVTTLERKVCGLQELASTLQQALQGCSETSQRFFAFEIEEEDLRKELSDYTTAGVTAIAHHEAVSMQHRQLEEEARAAAAAAVVSPKVNKKGKNKVGIEGSYSPKKRPGGGSGIGASVEATTSGGARYSSDAMSNHDSVMPPLGRNASKPAGNNYGASGGHSDGSNDSNRKRTFLPAPSHERYSPAGGYGSALAHEGAESFGLPHPSANLRGGATRRSGSIGGGGADASSQQPRLFESPKQAASSSRRPHNGSLEPLGPSSSKKPPLNANTSASAPNSNRSPMAEYAPTTSGSRSSEGGKRGAQRMHEPALPLTASEAFPPPLQDFDRSGGAGGGGGGYGEPLSSMGGAPLSSGLSSYRVRGKASSGGGSNSAKGQGNSKGGGGSSKKGGSAAHVTVINTEEAEESRLAAELAKAKARMAKHQKLQEWLKAKEEKEMALLDQEEARIQAAEKAEKAREKARQRRAKEAKKALKKHYAQLHADADLAEQPPPRSAQSAEGYGDQDQDSGNDVLRPSSTLVPYMASTQPSGTAATTPGEGTGSYVNYGDDEGFPPGSQDGGGEFDQYIGDSVVSGDYAPDEGEEDDDEDYNGAEATSARSEEDDEGSDEN